MIYKFIHSDCYGDLSNLILTRLKFGFYVNIEISLELKLLKYLIVFCTVLFIFGSSNQIIAESDNEHFELKSQIGTIWTVPDNDKHVTIYLKQSGSLRPGTIVYCKNGISIVEIKIIELMHTKAKGEVLSNGNLTKGQAVFKDRHLIGSSKKNVVRLSVTDFNIADGIFSSDDRYILLIFEYHPLDGTRKSEIWDLISNKIVFKSADSCNFSPKGKTLGCFNSNKKTLQLIDFTKGFENMVKYNIPINAKEYCSGCSIVFNNNETQVAIDYTDAVQVWNINKNNLSSIKVFETGKDLSFPIFDLTDKYFALEKNNEILIYNTNDFNIETRIKNNFKKTEYRTQLSIQFTQDTKFIIIHDSNDIGIYSFKTGELVAHMIGLGIQDATIDSSGNLLIADDDRIVTRYKGLNNQVFYKTKGEGNALYKVKFAHNRDYIFFYPLPGYDPEEIYKRAYIMNWKKVKFR